MIISLVGNKYGKESDVALIEKDVTIRSVVHEEINFYKFVEKSYILDKANKSLLPKDRLTIRCKLYHLSHSDIIQSSEHLYVLPVQQNSYNFEQFFDTKNLADIKFIVEGKVLIAHKVILSSRSSVFTEIINKMNDKIDNMVRIDDVGYIAMREVLRFIYCGKVNDLEEVAKDLLVAAVKYKLEDLKTLCQNSLILEMNFNNVVEIWELAHRHGTDTLKKAAMKFLTSSVMEVKDLKYIGIKGLKGNSNLLEEMLNALLSAYK